MTYLKPALCFLLVGMLAVTLTGCGGDDTEDLWQRVQEYHDGPLQSIPESANRGIVVDSIDHMLAEHPDASEELSNALAELRTLELRRTRTESAAERQELSEKIDIYWEHLGNRELPPDDVRIELEKN